MEGETSQVQKNRKGSATTVLEKVKARKRLVVLYKRPESIHIYNLMRILRSTSVDDVSTPNRMKGLIRTTVNTWRSTYEENRVN